MRKKVILTNNDIKTICDDFLSGLTLQNLAIKFQKRQITIKKILIENNINVDAILANRPKKKTTFITKLCGCGCEKEIVCSKASARRLKYLKSHPHFKNEIDDTHKICETCNKNQEIKYYIKYIDEYFGSIRAIKYGGVCIQCQGENINARKEKYKSDGRLKAKKKAEREKHRGEPKYWIQEKISAWKRVSKETCNIISDLTVEYLVNLFYMQNCVCYYTGAKIFFGMPGHAHSNSASLDKLIPNKGYVKDNVVWCSYFVNTMKGKLSENEFYEFISNILKYKNMRNV